MSRRVALGVVALFCAMVSAVSVALVLGSSTQQPTRSDATRTVACVSGSWYECLEDEMRTAAAVDPAAAIERYRDLARSDTRVREVCHGLFHAIGQGAAGSGRAVWDVLMLGSSECNWGYVHGIVEGFLGDAGEDAVARAEELCTPPVDLPGDGQYISSVAGNCVHGTGHAFYRTTRDPIEAEQACRGAFSDDGKISNCVDGMIMEFGGSQEALQGMFGDICMRIGADVRLKCYSNIALTWYNQMGRDTVAVLERCAEAGSADLVLACASGAANLFTAMEGFDLQVGEICASISAALQEGCYRGVAVGGGLGVNNGSITRESLDRFLETIPNRSWLPGIEEELARAEAGFGASADESL